MDILPEILSRKTTRSFVCDGKMELKHLRIMFEAACKAPSSYNAQPWRFFYAHRDSAQWAKLFELLVPANAAWASSAEWLVLAAAYLEVDVRGTVSKNLAAHFDVGAACQNLTLQASSMGFASAIVGGFDHKKAADLIGNHKIEPLVMIVLGSEDLASFEARAPRKSIDEVISSSFGY